MWKSLYKVRNVKCIKKIIAESVFRIANAPILIFLNKRLRQCGRSLFFRTHRSPCIEDDPRFMQTILYSRWPERPYWWWWWCVSKCTNDDQMMMRDAWWWWWWCRDGDEWWCAAWWGWWLMMVMMVMMVTDGDGDAWWLMMVMVMEDDAWWWWWWWWLMMVGQGFQINFLLITWKALYPPNVKEPP